MFRGARSPLRVFFGSLPGPLNTWQSGWTRRSHCAPTMSLDIQCEQSSDARWTELLPSIQQYEVVRSDDCGLTEVRCKDISSAVQANPASTELSLRTNESGDGGVGSVLQGSQNPTCKIQKSSLQNCGLTEAGCGISPGMSRSLSTSRELHLNDNPMGDAGSKSLCEGLQDPQCRLEKLQLEYCNLTATSCEPSASVLRVKADFKELVLSNNDLHEPGVRISCQGSKDSACQSESLKSENCGITAANCKDSCDVVASKASLQESDLSSNKLGNAGIAASCPGSSLPSCKLRTSWLWECDITAEGCKDSCRVLRAKQSSKELSLASNESKDEGARSSCESLLEPGCQSESSWIKTCSLTAASCPYFCSVLTKSRSSLESQMSSNPSGDEGVQELCKASSQPDTVSRELWLGDCDVTNSGCSSLANVSSANRSSRESDLSNNCMGGPGVSQSSESLKQPSCTLQQLVSYDIYWTNEVEEQLRASEEERPSSRIIS